MDSYTNGSNMPMGFGIALAQNLAAMNHFSSLPQEQQDRIIEQTRSIESKEEMQSFVDSLHSNGLF